MQPETPQFGKTAKVAADIGRTLDTHDDTVAAPDTDRSPEPQQPESTDQDKAQLAGYDPVDLAKAPVRPPQSGNSDGRQATSNNKVVFLVGGALIVFILGIILAVVGAAAIGAFLIIVAALAVVVGVFLPIGQGDWNKNSKKT